MFKNNNSSKYFILTIIIPIIGIIGMFSYAYFYVEDEINITTHELQGLNKIIRIQDLAFDIQRLRGLSNIIDKDKLTKQKIAWTIDDIKSDISELKYTLKKEKQYTSSNEKILKFLNYLSEDVLQNINFKHITKAMHRSILLVRDISYSSYLILDPKLRSYILIENIVQNLPELIEHNGQVRALCTSMQNNKLNVEKRNLINIEISKVEEVLLKIEFLITQFYTKKESEINISYQNMLNAQIDILSFTKNNTLKQKHIAANPIDIYKHHTENINLIISFYYMNSQELNKLLQQRIDAKTKLSNWILITAIIALIFIIYINLVFFNKNKKIIETIQELSITDGMTKLYNRRHFDDIFEKQQKIQQREKENFIFIMMDIDHFKQYNDIYGHQAGDNTLIAVAKSLKNDLQRPSDMVFRLGGEEFGVLCNDMPKDKAVKFANKLRVNIQNLNIEHKGNTASEFVTISMGLIIIEPNIKYDMKNIYTYADKALYNAKENGRNQVAIFNLKSLF